MIAPELLRADVEYVMDDLGQWSYRCRRCPDVSLPLVERDSAVLLAETHHALVHSAEDRIGGGS